VTERCERTDLLVDQCAHCTGRDGGESAEAERLKRLLTRRHVFPARYAGACSKCGEHFGEGAPIIGAGDGRYLGPCCMEDDRATG
jgi:hypothetical protein